MTAYIDGPRYLLQIGPSCGGEARGQGVFGEERFAQSCEACCRSCLVFWVGGCVDGELNAEVGNNLVGGPAAVAGLEWREGLDLPCVSGGREARRKTHSRLLLEHIAYSCSMSPWW